MDSLEGDCMNKEGFVLPLAMIFLLFTMIVSVFLASTTSEIFKTSRELDTETLEKYEKIGYVSVMNTWNAYLTENKTWDEHHQINETGDVSTLTTIVFPKDFFTIKLVSNKPCFRSTDLNFTVNSSSAYYEDNEFTLEMSSTKNEEDSLASDYQLVENNLMVTFAQAKTDEED